MSLANCSASPSSRRSYIFKQALCFISGAIVFTSLKQNITIKANSGLKEDEVEKMIRDAEENSSSDQEFEDLIKAKNQCDGIIHETKKQVKEAEGKLDDNIISEIKTAIKNCEEASKKESKSDIDAAIQTLTEKAKPLVEMAQQQAQASADSGTQPKQEQKESDTKESDGVVDAEFEEVKNKDKK